MPRTAEQPLSESPLYIRWGPDRCPYSLELKLGLVSKLRDTIAEGATTAQEIGAILIGSLPTLQTPTLRIEDVEVIRLRPGDGSTFILEGGGDRFAEIRRRARAKERTVVGLFRSHLRSGSLRPSLADRTLLASEFKEPIYALLLTSGTAPFDAAFFVASNGPLPAEPSVREFKLNVADFQALPELEPEYQRQSRGQPDTEKSGRFRTLGALLLIALCLVGTLYYFNRSLFLELLPSRPRMELIVRSEDGLHRITWNIAPDDLDRAKSGVITLIDAKGMTNRQFQIGLDELRVGAIVVENSNPQGQIRLALLDANSPYVQKSVSWH